MIVVDEYKQAINTLFHPGAATKPMSIVESLMYYWKATAIPFVLVAIEAALVGSALSLMLSFLISSISALAPLLGAGIFLSVLVIWLILIPASLLVNAALLHLFGKILLKWFQGSYADTFAGFVYGTAAGYSLIWIPVLGWIVAAIGTLIADLVAVANQNKTTWVKVLAAAIVEIVALNVLFFILRAVNL